MSDDQLDVRDQMVFGMQMMIDQWLANSIGLRRLAWINTFADVLTFPKQQILDSSKLKEFAYDNFKFEENGRKGRKKTLLEKEKLLVTSNFSYFHSVLKRLVRQTCKTQGLFGKGLNPLFIEQGLTLSQTTNSRPYQTERDCRR